MCNLAYELSSIPAYGAPLPVYYSAFLSALIHPKVQFEHFEPNQTFAMIG